MTEKERGGRSNSPTQASPVRLSGMRQLVAVLPHLVGYRLDTCIVLVVTRPAGSRRVGSYQTEVVCTARMDLPATEHLGPELVDALLPAVRQATTGGPALLHLFGYDLPETGTGADRDADEEAVRGLDGVGHELAVRSGAVLHDLVLLRDGCSTLREIVAGGERTSSRAWVEAPVAADVPAAADLVLEGRSPSGSRDDVVQRVRHLDERAVAATDLAVSVLSLAPERLDDAEALQALARWVLEGMEPSPRQRAWIALVLHDRTLRDAVLARWIPALFRLDDILGETEAADLRRWVPGLDRDRAHEALERLLVLVSQVPRGLGAPLLTLTGMIAWAHGEGTVANEACDLALEVDAGYRMAQLLQRALTGGLRPPRAGDRSRPDGAGHPHRCPAA